MTSSRDGESVTPRRRTSPSAIHRRAALRPDFTGRIGRHRPRLDDTNALTADPGAPARRSLRESRVRAVPPRGAAYPAEVPGCPRQDALRRRLEATELRGMSGADAHDGYGRVFWAAFSHSTNPMFVIG